MLKGLAEFFDVGFLQTVVASGFGFIVAQIIAAWFNSRVGHAGYLEGERNNDVAAIERLTEGVSNTALSYWFRVGSEDDREDITEIVSSIFVIGLRTEALFDCDAKSKSECDAALDRLEDIITGGEFGSIIRKADPTKATLIRTTAYEFVEVVRRRRRKLKPRWFA